MTTRARVVIRNGREKSLRRFHPWVFSGAIDRVEGRPESGGTVDLVDQRGGFLARAAFSPESQIRARVWTFDPAEEIDESFFRRRLERAIEMRRALGMLETDTACRLVFSESDGLPGLVVDYYAGFLVCQFLSAGTERWRDAILGALVELLRPRGIYERSEGSGRRKEGLESRNGAVFGSEPPPVVEYRSGTSRRLVSFGHGQKTGAYLDQQDNRQRVARYAAGARILDAFAYTGGFATAGLLQGGIEATLVDSSADALRGAAEEAGRNGVAEKCRFIEKDVFAELRALKEGRERFDLVVLDPPKFVHAASQIKSGSRGYKDINLIALQLVVPGGVLATFSCSGHVDPLLFQKILAGAAVDARRPVQILERLSQPADHPIALEFPEAEYLTGLILKVH